MPELPNRQRAEAMLRRAFLESGKRYRPKLIELLGEPPNPENVPESYWRSMGNDLRTKFEPILNEIYLDSVRNMIAATTIEMEWALPNAAAAEWAKRYSYQLVRQINQTSVNNLQDIFERFFTERGMKVGDLRKLIEPQVQDLIVTMRSGTTRILTSAARAKLIATTEVTRAAVEGERTIIQQIEETGIEMVPIWETQQDDKVCPICAPRQGKEQGDGWDEFPPAHPGCYCSVRYEPRAMREVAHG